VGHAGILALNFLRRILKMLAARLLKNTGSKATHMREKRLPGSGKW
jgi:hypothetical protein